MPPILDLASLEGVLGLSPEERAWREDGFTVPLRISGHCLSLIDPSDPRDPIRRQFVPTAAENAQGAWEDPDPLAEEGHSVNARLVRRYRNRAAFLATDHCAAYCRHCFRRRFTGTLQGPATEAEIEDSARFLASRPEIRELLLTGGDVLTLDDAALDAMIGAFRKARPDLMIRLCTRTPSTWPERITGSLVEVLRRHASAPIFVLTQFNHPREICAGSREALGRLRAGGFIIFNQAVLLRGVNDDAEVLAELFEGLLALQVKPYYLFQCDLVRGTGHFRVPLEEGLAIYRRLSTLVSGLALPFYAIDLPSGGGKVVMGTADAVKDPSGRFYSIRTPEGGARRYPTDL